VSDFRRKAFVVHEEQVKFSDIINQEFLETAWEQMTCLLVAPVTNLWHCRLALEAAPDPVINTLGFPPCFLNTVITVGLMAFEVLGALLDNGNFDGHGGL
jgi:hypothetical protein